MNRAKVINVILRRNQITDAGLAHFKNRKSGQDSLIDMFSARKAGQKRGQVPFS